MFVIEKTIAGVTSEMTRIGDPAFAAETLMGYEKGKKSGEVYTMRYQSQAPARTTTVDVVAVVAAYSAKYSGLVPMIHIREVLVQQGCDRATQDKLIDLARRQGKLTATGYEGRVGVSQLQRGAALPDGSGYLSLRQAD